jgi:ribosomal protein L22
MSDETPEIESEEEPKPRRRRRSRRKVEEAPEVTSGGTAASSSDVDVTSDAESEIDPTAEDEQAEDAAADVVLEADDEAEGEPEAESEEAPEAEPARPRRRGGRSSEPTAPPAAAPTRRRSRRDPDAPIPVVRAQAKYVRSSARKARLVCDNIRGRNVEDARAILALTPRAIARDWSKLLESAVANAEHNHELVGEDLYIKAVHADEGPTIRRFRPRAMGRATKIRKRTSHLTILLTPKE